VKAAAVLGSDLFGAISRPGKPAGPHDGGDAMLIE